MMDMYGFLPRDWRCIEDSLKQFPEIERVILFGSRAMAIFKAGSDVDLAVVGCAVTPDTLIKLGDLLNEMCPIPYVFDLQKFESISNENLKEHIRTYGKDIYVAKPST